MAAYQLPEGWSEIEEPAQSLSAAPAQLPAGWSEVAPSKGVNITMNASPSGIPKTKQPTVEQMADTLGQMESSGNYNARGKPVKGMSAIGKYQIMPQNIGPWSKEVLGREVTPEEFAASPELQDKIARGKIANYLAQGYSTEDIPSLWLSGRPAKGNTRKDTVAGTDVPSYVKKFTDMLGLPQAQAGVHKALYQAAAAMEGSPSIKNFVRSAAPSARSVANTAYAPVFGAAEGIADTGASAVNLALDALNAYKGSKYHVEAPKFGNKVEPGMVNDALFGLGKLGGELTGGGAVFKGLGAIPKLGNEASMFANAARGAGAGAITGEQGPGGRVGSAAIGGALSPLTRLTNTSIANRVAGSAENEIGKSSKGFNNVFNNLPKDEIVMPKGDVNLSTISRAIPKKERGPFEDYLMEPTIENAHKAQSVLGAQERSIQAEINKSGNSFSRTKRMDAISEAKESIQNGLGETLEKFPGKNKLYQSERGNYKENVVPYLDKEINLYRAGKQSPEKTVNNLYKNWEWMKKTTAGKKHGKSIAARHFLNALLSMRNAKGAAGVGLGALGITEAKKTYDRYNDQ